MVLRTDTACRKVTTNALENLPTKRDVYIDGLPFSWEDFTSLEEISDLHGCS